MCGGISGHVTKDSTDDRELDHLFAMNSPTTVGALGGSYSRTDNDDGQATERPSAFSDH